MPSTSAKALGAVDGLGRQLVKVLWVSLEVVETAAAGQYSRDTEVGPAGETSIVVVHRFRVCAPSYGQS